VIAETSSSCGNALVERRRRIATTAVGFTRIPHSLSFAHICSSPFAALHLDELSRSSVEYHSFPGTTKLAILDIVPMITPSVRTPNLVHDCIRPFQAHRVLLIVECCDLRDMHPPIASRV